MLKPETTAKEALLHYLEQKRDLIKKATKNNYLYIVKTDLDEIRLHWSERSCYVVVKRLNADTAEHSCPWCVYTSCSFCGYAKRNKRCGQSKHSRFSKILKLFRKQKPNELLVTYLRNDLTKIIKETKNSIGIEVSPC